MEHQIKIDSFELESGEVVKDISMSYHSFGKLNAEKDNVIWVCHALTANGDVSDWWSGLYGPGNLFDPEKHFIVCLNNLASPYGSFSPKHVDSINGIRYGLFFPKSTLRDSANLHLYLIEQLGIKRIELLIGGSCGGNIALEISYVLKEHIKAQVLLCSSAKESPWSIGIHEAQRMILESDPSFQENKDGVAYEALGNCRAMAMPFYRNQINFSQKHQESETDKLEDFKASSYLRYQAKKFADRYDAHCYHASLSILDTHNIARGRGDIESVLNDISVPSLCISLNTDIFIPPVEQRFLARHLKNGFYHDIETPYGHDGFLIEFDQIRKAVFDFLVQI